MRPAISRIIQARGGFDPAWLFKTGVKSLWLDPSDITTLWQDNLKITPVSADGDTIGYVADKSLGARDFSSTLTARPLYKTTDGLKSILLDGSNDVLTGTGDADSVALSNSISAFTIIIGFSVTASGAIGGIFFNGTTAAASRFNIFKDASDLLSFSARRLDADSTSTLTGVANNGKKIVYSLRWNGTSTEVIIRVNGREMSRSNAWLTAGSTSATDSSIFNIGSQNATNFASMSLYGVIAVADLLPQNTVYAAEAWMAKKMAMSF